MPERYLVTAAAGGTGRATCHELLARGQTVRALVRHDDARARALRTAGAEVVVGSLTDSAAVRTALTDVQRAYFTAPFMPSALDAAVGFAAAAEESGLEAVVSMSQWLADPSHPSAHTRRTWLADTAFRWMPSVGNVSINPGFFADNYMAALGPTAQFGVLAMPLGRGRNAPPSNEDLARVVTALLLDPSPHFGQTYRPTGPSLLSPNEIATCFARALGRPVSYRDVPFSMMAKVARSVGFDDYAVAQLRWYMDEYQADTFAVNAPTDVVLELTGRPAEPLEVTIHRYAATIDQRINVLSRTRSVGSLMAAMMRRVPTERAYRARYSEDRTPGEQLAGSSTRWRESHMESGDGLVA